MCCFTLIPFSSLSSFHIHWLLLLTSCCFLLKKCHWFFTYPFWPSLPSQLGSCSYNQDTDFWCPQHLDTTQSLLSSHLWSQQGIACPALTLEVWWFYVLAVLWVVVLQDTAVDFSYGELQGWGCMWDWFHCSLTCHLLMLRFLLCSSWEISGEHVIIPTFKWTVSWGFEMPWPEVI